MEPGLGEDTLVALTADLITRIKRRLSRVNTPGLDVIIIDEMIQAKVDLEAEPTLPLFLVVKQDITNSTEEFDLNTKVDRFLRIYNEDGLRYNNGNVDPAAEPWIKVEKFESLDRLVGRWPGQAVFPQGYVVIGETVHVQQRPTTVNLGYRVRYYRAEDPAVFAGETSLWKTKESTMLIALTGIRVAQYLRDTAGQQYWVSEYQTARSKFTKRQSAIEWADFDSSRGED